MWVKLLLALAVRVKALSYFADGLFCASAQSGKGNVSKQRCLDIYWIGPSERAHR